MKFLKNLKLIYQKRKNNHMSTHTIKEQEVEVPRPAPGRKTPKSRKVVLKKLKQVRQRVLEKVQVPPDAGDNDLCDKEESCSNTNNDNITSISQYTFSSKGYYSFYTMSYVLQEFIFKQKYLITFNKHTHEQEYDYKNIKKL